MPTFTGALGAYNTNQYTDPNDPLVSKYAQPNTTSYQLKKNFFNLSDPNSDFYQIFQQRLQNVLSSNTPTTATLLSGLRASGVGYGGSQAIANEQREAIEARNREAANQGVLDIFLQGQGLANQAGGTASQHFLQKEGYEDQRRLNRQMRRDALLNNIINTGVGLSSYFVGGGGSGALSASGGASSGGATLQSGFVRPQYQNYNFSNYNNYPL